MPKVALELLRLRLGQLLLPLGVLQEGPRLNRAQRKNGFTMDGGEFSVPSHPLRSSSHALCVPRCLVLFGVSFLIVLLHAYTSAVYVQPEPFFCSPCKYEPLAFAPGGLVFRENQNETAVASRGPTKGEVFVEVCCALLYSSLPSRCQNRGGYGAPPAQSSSTRAVLNLIIHAHSLQPVLLAFKRSRSRSRSTSRSRSRGFSLSS